MKGNMKLYKKRLALVLAIVLTFGSVIPVNAANLSDNAGAAAQTTAEGQTPVSSENSVSSEAPSSNEQAPAGETVSDSQPGNEGGAGGASENGNLNPNTPVSQDAAVSSDEAVSGNDTVSGNVSENLTVSANVSEDSAGKTDSVSAADVTIMYYMVGSNLEGNGVEATRDMIEVITGMQWAENAPDAVSNAKVNVIMETGGCSDSSMDTGGSHKKALNELENSFKSGETASENDLQILMSINSVNNGKGIQWNYNERWELSGNKITEAKNKVTDSRRVMTGDGNTAPELIDFITTTAKEYPARNYMLVLWDHGGGPKGGFGGDDRGGKNTTYIMNDQLTKSLSEASLNIRKSGISCNENFDKFAFIGFDACLMGNLETAMALEPYADYLFASEDLEPGTGWDHRGYVQEMLYPWSVRQSGSNGSEGYDPEFLNYTVRNMGVKMVEDNTAFYNKIDVQSTMAVVSLDKVSFNALNDTLNDLSEVLIKKMIDENNKFTRLSYVKILEAAEESINFNGAGEGIVDLYSFCNKLSEKFGNGDITNKVKDIIKPAGHNDSIENDGLITLQQYSGKYYFSKKNTQDEDYKALGGLTVFLPFKSNRFSYQQSGQTKVVDGLKDYLEIYKKVQGPSIKLSSGYVNLIKAFCAAQAIGSVLNDQYDETPAKISSAMNDVAVGIYNDYAPLEQRTAHMMNNMADENGEIINGRLSSNDLYMMTIVDEAKGELIYGLDLQNEKVNLVKKLRQEPVIIGKDGRKHRLGYLPAAEEEPYKLYENGDGNKPTGKQRYEIKNRKEQKWFYMNDVPAAILNIRNLSSVSEQDFYDPFAVSRNVIVQFPAIMQKDNASYSELVVLEAEFKSGSANSVPDGYYSVNTDSKQLTGYVPWESVSNDTCFWPVSDLEEFFENTTNDFNPDNASRGCYSDGYYKEKEGGKLYFSRDRGINEGLNLLIQGDNIKSGAIDFEVRDIFGGGYGLGDLREGEAVTAYITLSGDSSKMKPEEIKDGITYISQNRQDIYPIVSFMTNSQQYTLSFNEGKEPRVGYYDSNGKFHPLTESKDFAALTPGTYRLSFEGYDSEKDCIIIDGDTPISINGVKGSVSASNYAFYPYVSNPTLTVGNSSSGLTIESIGSSKELPYGYYMTLKPYEDLMNFVVVRNGDGDVTGSTYTNFTISANGQEFNMTEDSGVESFKKLDLKPGDVISVNATFITDEGALKTSQPAILTIGRQPVKIYGTNPFETYEYHNDNLFWENKDYFTGNTYYSPSINIVMSLAGSDVKDREFGEYVGKDGLTIDKIISKNNVSAIYLNNNDTQKAGTYTDLYFGPDDGSGKKRCISWEDKHFIKDFTDYLVVENDEDTVLKEYIVHPAAIVSFRSLKDDTELFEDRIVSTGPEDYKRDTNDRFIISDGSLKIAGAPVKQWYIGVGTNNKRIPVYLDGKTEPYYEYEGDESVGKNLVLSQNAANNEWYFYLPKAASSNRVFFYADYEESISTYVENGKTTFGLSVDPIIPVEYTGKPLVTTTSGKNGSRTIELVVRNKIGKALTEGVDYKVSYKNNKNAAGPSAKKKAPTLIITGKGAGYKGLRIEAQFTILPADFRYVQVAANKKFAPFTSAGKIGVTTTLKLQSGVKIPAKQYEIKYYYDGDEITKDKIKEFYKGSDTKLIEIRAYAKAPKSGAKNYRIGSVTDSVYTTGYPKGSKKLTVKLSKSKQVFEPNMSVSVSDLAAQVVKKESLKVKKDSVSYSSLVPVKAYFDKNLTNPAADDGDTIDRAGTYYLSFELKDEEKVKNKVYRPTVVKYVMTGKKLVKGKTKIDAKSNTVDFKGSAKSVSVNVLIDTTKLLAEEMKLTYTTRDGASYQASVGYTKNKEKYNREYDFEIDDNGRLLLYDMDNGARGTYTLTFEGLNNFTGKFKLTYKVK